MSRAALITGASSDLGRGLALELARRGWDLALTARRALLLEGLKGEVLHASGGRVRVETAALDVTDHTRVRDAVRSLDEALGGFEVVVANAGVSGSRADGGPSWNPTSRF